MVLSNSELRGLFVGLGDSDRRKRCVSELYGCFAPQFHARLIKTGMNEPDERTTVINDAFIDLLHYVNNQIKKNKPVSITHPKAWFHRVLENRRGRYWKKKKDRRKREEPIDGSEYPVDNDGIKIGLADVLACIIETGGGDESYPAGGSCGEPAQVTEFRMSFGKVYTQYAARYPLCALAWEQRIVERVSFKELAVILGKKDGATRQFVSDCRKKLVALWKRYCPPPR